MPFLRIHTATRVVLGGSIEAENPWPNLPPDQSVVEVTFEPRAKGINGEYIRLSDDGRTIEPATKQQVDDADPTNKKKIDKFKRVTKELSDIKADILTNGETLVKLRAFFNKYNEL